jgi:sugar lactone lactonase YvrE
MPATPELFVEQEFEHPEGIVWDAGRQRLIWVDVFRGQIFSQTSGTGPPEAWSVGRAVGSVAPRQAGGLVCAVREGFGFLSEEGGFAVVAAPLLDTPDLQMNDGAVDARGRFWSGSMHLEQETGEAAGVLYCFDPESHTAAEKLGGITTSNGIGWSPDGRRCYYVDTATRRLDEFRFDVGRATLSDRTTLVALEDYPDGLAVDTEGCIWLAMWGGWEVRRYTPSGRLDRTVRLPGSQVTTCAFGGAALDTLFIAVSPYGLDEQQLRAQRAGIFALDVGVQGLPTHEFRG